MPKIIYSIENRKSRIVNDLDQAQKLKEGAEKKLKEYNEIIERSKKEAKQIMARIYTLLHKASLNVTGANHITPSHSF